MTKLTLLLSLVFLLGACSKTETPDLVSKETKAHRYAEFIRDSAQFTDSKGSDVDVISYFLKGRINWITKTVDAEIKIVLRIKDYSETKLILDSTVHKVKSVKHQQKEIAFKENKTDRTLEISLANLTEQELRNNVELQIVYEILARNDTEDSGFQIELPRKEDPVKSKVAFTFAEPEGASSWMPCHNTPLDRALFGSEFIIENGETLVSNGNLVRNEYLKNTNQHVMSYQTRYTIPTYLMAFTVGEYETKTLYLNSLPVSVVSRRGLRVDSSGILNRLIQFIGHYESLTVKYPFEKYMLVLIPNFISGGIEHAGITFQEESESSQSMLSGDLSLSAHELAHQWFGDLVTIRAWDDLWIKEGMATLLAEEALRFIEDQNKKGRLFGKNFAVVAKESVVDPKLLPDDKYTSGPYDRAAWVYTQLRSYLGEKQFWKMMQKMLTENAFGVIGTDDLLERYVADFAGNAFAAKMKTALFAKTLPVISAKETDSQIEVTVEDLEDLLLVPMQIRSVSNLNSAQTFKLSAMNSFKFQKGDLLLMNVGDVHPIKALLTKVETAKAPVLQAIVPRTEEQLNYLNQLSSEQSSNAISYGEGWMLEPKQFENFYAGLQSEDAKYNFIKLGCKLAKQSIGWKKAITESTKSFPVLGMSNSLKEGFSSCENLIDSNTYKPYWKTISQYPTHSSLTETNLLRFANFPGSSDEVYQTFKPVAELGFSVRAKSIAVMRLSQQFRGKFGAKPEKNSYTDWLSFFKKIILTSEVPDTVPYAIDAVVSASDKNSIPALKRVVETPFGDKIRKHALCGAHSLLKTEAIEWEIFKNSLSAGIPTYLKSLANSPEKCDDEKANL